MSRPRHRLFVEAPLGADAAVSLTDAQAHKLGQVLRLTEGDAVALFNGRDGEWQASLVRAGKKGLAARCTGCLAAQRQPAPTTLVFAPIKAGRLDLLTEKATELGATRLIPVTTRRTVVERVNDGRMAANAVEAAEQCGRLEVPEVMPLRRLDQVLGGWPAALPLFYCDEAGDAPELIAAAGGLADGPAALLLGPEGGFEPDERRLLRGLPFVRPVSLGPCILRAETAALSALALLGAARRMADEHGRR